MHPTPRLSSPNSPWSYTHSRSLSSATQDNLSPHTPDSYFFPAPAPAIVSPDEFTLQLDVQLDDVVGSPHKSITHLLPQPSLPSPKPDPCFLFGDDASKAQVLLRNAGRWGNMYDRFESSPPRVPPLLQDSASDDFSWEGPHSALVDPSQLPEPSRCSLLIHEVSLLVGLTADDDHLSFDGCPLLPDPSKQAHDILPLNLTPTKSLTSRKHRNARLPHPANTNLPVHSPDISISSSINPHADNASSSLYYQGHPPVGSRDPATPIPRHKSADASRPSLSPRRRQGQVFHFEPPLSNASHRNAVDLDDMFSYPRKPPPTPTPTPPANRCSSLDRLECSLLKLEAHAPGNHRKSRSEGRPSNRVLQRQDKRPYLPSPRLKQQQSSLEIMHRNPSRPAHGCRFLVPPAPPPRPMPPRQYIAPRSCPAVPLDDDPLEEDSTPSSFMDMDIPLTGEARPKRRTSLRHLKSKENMKSLASVAKRVSRGVIAWGKNLTGSTKPGATKETTTGQSARV